MTRDVKPSFFSQLIYLQLALIIAVVLGVFCVSIIGGDFGNIGGDSDDELRFLQVRDYLRGQGWFDTDQYRMGLSAAGTDMHWSRLPDIPIILLTHFFDIFVSQDKALLLAISIWPPITAVILFSALLIGAEHIRYDGDRKYLRVFVSLLAAIFLIGNDRFQSGSIDHHNLQFGFSALAMVMAMDPQMRFKRYFLAGLAAAISISIGPEVYLFAAVICGFIALNWAVIGKRANLGTQGFGIGLALGLSVIFAGTVPASNYTVVYCDALSLITITAAIFGGLGLAVIVKVSAKLGADDRISIRLMSLAALGVICLAVLSFQAPQCLSNPLKALPQDVLELWLGYIVEAMPAYKLSDGWQMLLPMMAGPLVLLLIVWSFNYYKRFKNRTPQTPLWDADVLNVCLFFTAFTLTIYQMRFFPFAYIFAILPLGRWVAQQYQIGKAKEGSNLKYILCLALTMPIIWALPGSLVVKDNKLDANNNSNNGTQASKDIDDCISDDVMAELNRLPTGLISASSNVSGALLIHTDHRVISGNYHRNWKGISAEIKISISPPDEAYGLLVKHKIDYVYYCEGQGLLRFVDHSPEGLIGQINDGNIPSFLSPTTEKPLNAKGTRIFKVVANK